MEQPAPSPITTSEDARDRPAFPLSSKAKRAAWQLCWILLARWTPPPMHAWRRFLLRLFGARVASRARIYASVRIWWPGNLELGERAWLGPRVDCYNQGRIRIGARVTVSQGAHLCASTHDYDDSAFPLVLRPILIADDAWIAADAFVGPGVTIGEGAVLGARGCALRDLDSWTVYSGNPAAAVGTRAFR